MKKKILALTLTLALLCALVLPAALPVSADSPEGVPPGQIERLEPGKKRLDPHTTVSSVGTEMRGGKKYGIYEVEIGSLPTTLGDNKTLIDTNWYLQTDSSGQTWFQTGTNLFTARVLGGRVSVEDEDGRLSVWDSSVIIGGETFSGGTAKIANDPINEYYEGNCLLWEYGDYSSGWWIFGTSAKVERYLRVIEGHISELWILPIDPKADVIIRLDESAEGNFGGHTNWLNASDASGIPLRVARNTFGSYVISASEFKDKTFPVTIDPTFAFYSSSYDDGVMGTGGTYLGARDAATGLIQGGNTGQVGQVYVSALNFYTVSRLMLMFNTAALPDDAIMSQVFLNLYGYDGGSGVPDNNFYLTVQSGMPTYPHMPVASADYNRTNYSGDGGSLYTSGWSLTSYNYLTLNSTGRSWLNKTGWTKFALRSSHDIDSSAPGANEYDIVNIRTYEYGMPYAPALSGSYTLPIVLPEAATMEASGVAGTQASLEGYLTDDGGEDCSLRFQYGITTSYGTDTSWSAGYDTGDYYSKIVYGLSPGTVYHYRIQAINSVGTDSGNDKTFTTTPNAPYNFSATPGDGTVALAWTKGSGADRTMIRRSTTAYPTSPTAGTQIYFGVGAAHNDGTVANGTEYFYSAWSEETGVYSITYVSDNATPSAPAAGDVTTLDAYNVAVATADLALNVDDMGGSAHVHVQFQYYWGAGAWGDNSTALSGDEGLGYYTIGVAGLPAATEIHVRARMQNDTGWASGIDVPFTTGANSAPTMTTQAATGLQLRGMTLNGVVTDDGGVTCTTWFEWGLTDSYGNSTPSISGLSTTDTFYYGLTGMEPNTTYHYRAVGQNTEGISYGADVTGITTTPTAPTARTDAASEIGANQAQLNLTVLTDGSVEVEVQFQWSTTGAYGGEEVDTGWVGGYTKDQTYSKLITGLTIGDTYHFRAQARNVGGTGSGLDVEFTTVFSAPTEFRAKAISSTTINVSWAKQGDLTYIRYKANGFPIDRADGDPVYFGPDEFTSVSGLIAGTTYYFRAWSQREGDVWADGYADDVATTQAVLPVGDEEVPEFVIPVEEPTTWQQEPSGAAITGMPFYGNIVNLMESYEVPEETGWLVIALFITIIAAIVAFTTVHNAFVAVAVGCIAITTCSVLGMLPFWFILIYITLGGGMIFVTRNRGM